MVAMNVYLPALSLPNSTSTSSPHMTNLSSTSKAHLECILASILAAKLDQHRQRAREALDGGAPLVVQQHVNRHERPTLGQSVIRLQTHLCLVVV